MDIVYIRELRIDTVIGVYDWEREVRQTVCLDLEMSADIRQAAQTDDIQYALNYHSVATRLSDFIEGSEFLLVETMAEQVCQIVREEFGVAWVKLRLSKPGALHQSRDVGLIIERGERP